MIKETMNNTHNKYNILFLHSQQDSPYINSIQERLSSLGIGVKTPLDYCSCGGTWATAITDVIRDSKYIAILLTQNSVNSKALANELFLAVDYAEDRDKIIIPIVESVDLLAKNSFLHFTLARRQAGAATYTKKCSAACRN